MALQAELLLAGDEQAADVGAVRVVAGEAVAVGRGRVVRPALVGGAPTPGWQPAQSFAPEALRSFLSSEACGVWQAEQSPSSTGLWV